MVSNRPTPRFVHPWVWLTKWSGAFLCFRSKSGHFLTHYDVHTQGCTKLCTWQNSSKKTFFFSKIYVVVTRPFSHTQIFFWPKTGLRIKNANISILSMIFCYIRLFFFFRTHDPHFTPFVDTTFFFLLFLPLPIWSSLQFMIIYTRWCI